MSDFHEEQLREDMDDPEWDEYRAYVEQTQVKVKLDVKDYIALFIASLETIFLPLIIMMLVFFAISVLLFMLV